MLNRGPIIVKKEGTERWLYEALRKLDTRSQQQTKSLAAISRGETPDGSGTPLVDLSKYFYLPGRLGGQVGHGASEPNGTLTLSSTIDTDKGFVYVGKVADSRVAFDEDNDRLGIGIDAPLTRLHIKSVITNTAVRPAADHSPSGNFSAVNNSPLYNCVDDSSTSPSVDTDYIRFSDSGFGSTLWNMDLLVNGFGGSNPVAGAVSVTLTVRARASSSSHDIGINLYFGNQIKQFLSDNVVSGGAHYTGHFYLSGKSTTASLPGVPFGTAGLGSSFNAYSYTLSATDLANISYANYPWIVSLEGSGALNSSGDTVDISCIEVTLSTGGTTYPLLRLDNGVVADTFDLGLSGGSDTDLQVTGAAPLYVNVGPTAASAVRLYADATTGYIEAGKNDQTLMNMTLQGNRSIQGTLLQSNFATTRVNSEFQLQGTTSSNLLRMKAAGGTTSYLITWPAAQSVGTTFLQNDGAGNLSWTAGGAGSGKTVYRWVANGPFIVDDEVDGAYIATSNMTLSTIKLWRGIAGAYGTTTIDLRKNGVSILSVMPSVSSSSGNEAIATGTISAGAIVTGDRLTIHAISAESGGQSDYSVSLEGS